VKQSKRINCIQVVIQSTVAIVTINNPPVNALAQPVRAALLDEFEQLQADDTVDAIVIRGSSGVFVAGADINEFNAPALAPVLVDVIARIEASRKPVVALIEGYALGGGLELAMGCHYRIAASNARLGLPEVRLGLLPGAGGTQRLPRLIDPGIALDMMLSGEPVNAHRALEIGLIDELCIEDGTQLLDYARSRAADFARVKDPPRRTGAIERAQSVSPQCESEVLLKHSQILRKVPSATHIVESVHLASRGSFEDGVGFARRTFEACRVGAVSRALRHLFFAERAANRADRSGGNANVIMFGSSVSRVLDACESCTNDQTVLVSMHPAFDPTAWTDSPQLLSRLVGYLPFQSEVSDTGVVVITRNVHTSSRAVSACVAIARKAGRQSVQTIGPFALVDARIRLAIDLATQNLCRQGASEASVQNALRKLGLRTTVSAEMQNQFAVVDSLDDEVLDVIVSGLSEAGKELVGEGRMESCDDYDVLLIHGYGFARHCGGPIWLMENTRCSERREIFR
jgi:hypothetical protein